MCAAARRRSLHRPGYEAMGVSAEKERAFFDRAYAQHLGRPDHELVVDRRTMLAALNDPAQTIWERRLLYLRVWEELMSVPPSGLRVLDFGCGAGDWGVLLATEGAFVTLLDLSPAAVELGLRRARASGVGDRVRGVARDGSSLECFSDGEFDLVFGSAALHHVLKYGPAVEELVRVLKPGGRLILAETLGNNALLNAARRIRAWLAREEEAQGEGILISDREIELLRSRFRQVDVYPLNLLAMAKRLFRGRFTWRGVRAMLRALEAADRALLARFPRLQRYCGEAVIVAVR